MNESKSRKGFLIRWIGRYLDRVSPIMDETGGGQTAGSAD